MIFFRRNKTEGNHQKNFFLRIIMLALFLSFYLTHPASAEIRIELSNNARIQADNDKKQIAVVLKNNAAKIREALNSELKTESLTVSFFRISDILSRDLNNDNEKETILLGEFDSEKKDKYAAYPNAIFILQNTSNDNDSMFYYSFYGKEPNVKFIHMRSNKLTEVLLTGKREGGNLGGYHYTVIGFNDCNKIECLNEGDALSVKCDISSQENEEKDIIQLKTSIQIFSQAESPTQIKYILYQDGVFIENSDYNNGIESLNNKNYYKAITYFKKFVSDPNQSNGAKVIGYYYLYKCNKIIGQEKESKNYYVKGKKLSIDVFGSSSSYAKIFEKQKYDKERAAIESMLNKLLAEKDAFNNKLYKLNSSCPAFNVVGDIKDRDDDDKFLVIWGRAFPTNSNFSHKGVMTDEGNIIVLKPNLNGIRMSFYQGYHYYIGKRYGQNAFGVNVPVKLYGEKPSSIKIEEKRLNNLIKAIDKKCNELRGKLISIPDFNLNEI